MLVRRYFRASDDSLPRGNTLASRSSLVRGATVACLAQCSKAPWYLTSRAAVHERVGEWEEKGNKISVELINREIGC